MKVKPIISIVKKIDNLGRIVVPKEVRKQFNIESGDELEFFTNGEYICMKKKQTEQNAMCLNCPYYIENCKGADNNDGSI